MIQVICGGPFGDQRQETYQQWFMQDYLKERLLHTNGLVSGGEFFHI